MNIQRSTRGLFRVTFTTTLLVVLSTALGQEVENVEDLAKQLSNLEVSFDLRESTANPNAEEAHADNVVVYREWDGPPLTNGIPLGFKVIDGDIIVPEDFDGQTATTYATNVWPGGVVPYEFDANVTGPNAAAMLVAMSWWENVAAVDFIPRTIEPFNFIHIQNNAFNNSSVGMQFIGQVINITSWNNTAIMAHELGHSLGHWHEQSRSDRGNFVTINTANICQNCCQQGDGSMGPCNFNFQIEVGSQNYGPYDFDSVMHYGRCDFSANRPACVAACPSNTGQTITVNAPFDVTWQCGSNLLPDPTPDGTFIGQRSYLSYWDSLVMAFMYPQSNWRFQSDIRGLLFNPGNFYLPFRLFGQAYEDTPVGGTLWILDPSAHVVVGGVLDKSMTIGAPVGGVTLVR